MREETAVREASELAAVKVNLLVLDLLDMPYLCPLNLACAFVLPRKQLNSWKRKILSNFCNSKKRVLLRFSSQTRGSQTVKGRPAGESELFLPSDTEQGKLTVAVEQNSRNGLTLVSNPVLATKTTAPAMCCEP